MKLNFKYGFSAIAVAQQVCSRLRSKSERPSASCGRRTQLAVGIAKSFLTLTMIAIATLLYVLPAWSADYNKQSLINADFSHQDLTDASFDHTNLRDSDLSFINASGVRFFGANLAQTNLEGANLSYATLESTRLTRANLTNAVLTGAYMTNALLNDATITGADFTGALLSPTTEKQLCEIASGTNPTTGNNTKDTLFCP